MRCSECRFFKKVIDLNNIKNEAGICYLNPPVSQMLVTSQGIANANARPQVNVNDFCSFFVNAASHAAVDFAESPTPDYAKDTIKNIAP